MTVRLLALVLLCACGRLGFDARSGTDGGVDAPVLPPGRVTVEVHATDEDLNPGLPVADAFVVFVAADGTTQVELTDASGLASAEVSGPTTVHVAYEPEPGLQAGFEIGTWRVISFEDIGGGTSLALGSRVVTPGTRTMTVNLPAETGALSYEVKGSIRCEANGIDVTTAVQVERDADCLGQSVPLYAVADKSTPSTWLDLGNVPFTEDGVSNTVGVAWMPTTTRRVRFPAVPLGSAAFVMLVDSRGGNEAVEIINDQLPGDGGDLVITKVGPSIEPDEMIAGVFGGPRADIVHIPVPPVVGGEYVLDPSAFTRSIATVDVEPSTNAVTWSYGAPAGLAAPVVATMRSFVMADGSNVSWSAYQPSTKTTIELAQLPAPLDTIRPDVGSVVSAQVLSLGLGDVDYAAAVPTLDRVLGQATNELELIPLGTALSRLKTNTTN